MKYIIFESLGGMEVPVIFPAFLQHYQVASKFEFYKPISGGMVHITEEGKIITSGDAKSIGKPSRDIDDGIIERCFNL